MSSRKGDIFSFIQVFAVVIFLHAEKNSGKELKFYFWRSLVLHERSKITGYFFFLGFKDSFAQP